jgi:anti-sigma factor RsiW
MTCPEMDERLDAWVDGTLPEAERETVSGHLAACVSCRVDERQLRELRAHASALPRSIAPRRDLWPGIAREIERRKAWSWPRLVTWQPLLAVAAAVVVALGAVFFGQPAATPVQTVVVPGADAGSRYALRPAAASSDPGVAAMERDYQDAATALLAALQERQGEIAPGTVQSVERNLAIIDQALAEVHEALEQDPGRPELGRMLVSTHRKRVEVLRKMVELSSTL